MKKHLLLLLLLFLVTGCREAVKPELSPASVTTPESSALYVYGQKNNAKELILKIGGEPMNISAGYLKLSGTILADEPLAVLEIGGRGQVLRVGEQIAEYQIVNILEREVKLCSRK